MPEFKHKQPCSSCPWRRQSAPGWLGSDTPEGFLATTKGECHMPCHATIDYDDPAWKASQLPDAPLCAGALIFLRNSATMPRDPVLREAVDAVEPDHENVFSHGQQFIDHHKSLGLHNTARAPECTNCTAKVEPNTLLCAECEDKFCFGCKTVAGPATWACCGDLKCKCGGCLCGENWHEEP